jgi:hypothetical protein
MTFLVVNIMLNFFAQKRSYPNYRSRGGQQPRHNTRSLYIHLRQKLRRETQTRLTRIYSSVGPSCSLAWTRLCRVHCLRLLRHRVRVLQATYPLSRSLRTPPWFYPLILQRKYLCRDVIRTTRSQLRACHRQIPHHR